MKFWRNLGRIKRKKRKRKVLRKKEFKKERIYKKDRRFIEEKGKNLRKKERVLG